MPGMSLSVVLQALDDAHHFPTSLPHLAKELALVEPMLGPIELVIVDDASSDGSARIAGEYLELFSERTPHPAPVELRQGHLARAGVAAATGRGIAFIDDARTVDAAHLTALASLLEDADVVLSYCPPVAPDQSLAGVGRQRTVAAYHRVARRLTATAIADGHHHFAAIRAEAAKPLFALLQSAGFKSDVKARIVMMSMGLRIVELPAAEPATAERRSIQGHQSSPHQDLVSEMVFDLVQAHRHRARAQAAVRRTVVMPTPKSDMTMPADSQTSTVLIGSTAAVEES